MKIAATAVASLACLQYSLAFVGPQFANRAATTSKTSKLNLLDYSDGEIPGWIGPASAVVASLTVASQVAVASVDVPATMSPAIVQVMSGTYLVTTQVSCYKIRHS